MHSTIDKKKYQQEKFSKTLYHTQTQSIHLLIIKFMSKETKVILYSPLEEFRRADKTSYGQTFLWRSIFL